MTFFRTALLVLLISLPVFVFAEAFTPLTTAPGFDKVGEGGDLSGFLNLIYKICVGAAAALAILQIIRAGIIYMMGDSITEKKEAKDLIAAAIFGLILVLSPYIVFSVINPDILSLQVNVGGLGEGGDDGGDAGEGTEEEVGNGGGGDGGEDGGDEPADSATTAAEEASCAARGGFYENGNCFGATSPDDEQATFVDPPPPSLVISNGNVDLNVEGGAYVFASYQQGSITYNGQTHSCRTISTHTYDSPQACASATCVKNAQGQCTGYGSTALVRCTQAPSSGKMSISGGGPVCNTASVDPQ